MMLLQSIYRELSYSVSDLFHADVFWSGNRLFLNEEKQKDACSYWFSSDWCAGQKLQME